VLRHGASQSIDATRRSIHKNCNGPSLRGRAVAFVASPHSRWCHSEGPEGPKNLQFQESAGECDFAGLGFGGTLAHRMKSVLETPSRRRRAEFLAAVARSRGLHSHFASPPQTVKAFEKNIKRFDSPAHIGYWVLTEQGELAGVVNINEIVRASSRSGYLGYYAFVPHNGHGYMSAGIRAVLSRAFGALHLHRLEANIQPDNEPSRLLVQRLGFRLEGFSPRYLKVAGKWRDHERWALTAEEWRKSR
jgi:[ribosomal protein S5]-alanine N-acetyltransferase